MCLRRAKVSLSLAQARSHTHATHHIQVTVPAVAGVCHARGCICSCDHAPDHGGIDYSNESRASADCCVGTNANHTRHESGRACDGRQHVRLCNVHESHVSQSMPKPRYHVGVFDAHARQRTFCCDDHLHNHQRGHLFASESQLNKSVLSR